MKMRRTKYYLQKSILLVGVYPFRVIQIFFARVLISASQQSENVHFYRCYLVLRWHFYFIAKRRRKEWKTNVAN